MDGYNALNYTEQGGAVTHIGGRLVIDEGGSIEGLPSAENLTPGTGTGGQAVRNDLNALIAALKNAGIMIPDAWNLAVRLAPALTDPVAAANNAKASVALADGVITVTADVDELEESTSSAPGQGTHKWIGLGIGTGLSSVALCTYNGSQLTAADAEEAVSVGLDQPGEFVLYIRAEELAETPKTITLKADGYAEVSLSIIVAAPAEE